jgi:hypothetical protein
MFFVVRAYKETTKEENGKDGADVIAEKGVPRRFCRLHHGFPAKKRYKKKYTSV